MSTHRFYPGWMILVEIAAPTIAVGLVTGSQDFGLPWTVSVPIAVVITLGALLLERRIDRRYEEAANGADGHAGRTELTPHPDAVSKQTEPR